MKKRQEVYDLYWYFACERQNIFIKKLNGEPAPWTKDLILQEYKFCNSYRVNDRVSQYLLKNVIYNGKSYSNEDMLFRILLFKLFNKESTWELLLNNFEDTNLKNFNFFPFSCHNFQFITFILVEHVDQTGIFPKKRGRLPEK